eukprot:gene9017-9981_t
MAPKKKGKADKQNDEEDTEERKPTGPTEKELKLKEELQNLTATLELQKKQHEYMSYMTKKTQKRQAAIVSLSDQNAYEIQQINNQKEHMLKEYEEKKTALQHEILNKEAELAVAKRELVSLRDYQVLQQEQEAEISKLEKEVYEMRVKHSDAVQKLKTKFITEKCAFQDESDKKIGAMAKEANMEAQRCLHDHKFRIKEENRFLRKELLGLIQETRVLHQHKKQLDEQHKILIREKQYASHLQSLRKKRQDEVYETFGLKLVHDSVDNVDKK